MADPLKFWRQGVRISSTDQLPSHIPVPGGAQGHRRPYVGAQGRNPDNWAQIEDLMRSGNIDNRRAYKVKCVGCQVENVIVQTVDIIDATIKWLCGDCMDGGMCWAKDVLQHDMYDYQVVKEFPDDTLLIRVSKSINPKDPIHKPIDAVEEAAKKDRLTRKKFDIDDL